MTCFSSGFVQSHKKSQSMQKCSSVSSHYDDCCQTHVTFCHFDHFFSSLENKRVLLFPLKLHSHTEMQLFDDMTLVSWWILLMLYLSACLQTSPLLRTPPPQPVLNKLTVSKKRNPACLLLKSLCCVCVCVCMCACECVCSLFSSLLVSSLFLCGRKHPPPPPHPTPGQRWMYHSRALSDLLWTGVHYTELTSSWLWKGMPLVEVTVCSTSCCVAGVVKSALMGGFSLLILFNHNCKVTEAATRWLSDLKTSALRRYVEVCVKKQKQLPVLDMIYFDKKRQVGS